MGLRVRWLEERKAGTRGQLTNGLFTQMIRSLRKVTGMSHWSTGMVLRDRQSIRN